MIRVLHSELQSNIGGIESFLLNLTKTIDKTNLQFDFLMRGNNSYLETSLKNLGANIYKVPDDYIGYYKFVKKILIQNQYDFVHVHKNSAANILLPIMVKKYTNAKLIVHSHNTNPSGGAKVAIVLHKINRKRLLKLSDYQLACSDTAAEWMFGNNYNKSAEIIKNGIIVKDYIYNEAIRKRIRNNLKLNDSFVIGHVGGFRDQKNHKFLIRVFSKLDIPNAKLILVGDGNLRSAIQQQAKELKVDKKVIFLGNRNDVNDILQAFDIFVMPSLWEGLGIAAVEAQTNGLPTLLSPNFPSDIKITDKAKFLPLSIPEWKDEIEKLNGKKNNRNNTISAVEKAGYDMSYSAKKIRKIYFS